MPTVASAPLYAMESTVPSTPEMRTERSDALSSVGRLLVRLLTLSESAVPPAVEPQCGLTSVTSGVEATSYASCAWWWRMRRPRRR